MICFFGLGGFTLVSFSGYVAKFIVALKAALVGRGAREQDKF